MTWLILTFYSAIYAKYNEMGVTMTQKYLHRSHFCDERHKWG